MTCIFGLASVPAKLRKVWAKSRLLVRLRFFGFWLDCARPAVQEGHVVREFVHPALVELSVVAEVKALV